MNPATRLRIAAPVFAALLTASCGGTAAPTDTDTAPEGLPAGAIACEYADGHLYFDARIRDTIPARLLFDTGATDLSVDSLWLARSGFEPEAVGQALLRGAGSQTVRLPLLLDTIRFRVDTLCMECRATAVIGLKEILGRRADGIFGLNYWADRCVEFDLRRGYVRAASPDTLAEAGFVRLPLRRSGRDLLVAAEVALGEGCRIAGEFLLDTGCGPAAVVNAPAARQAGFDRYEGPKIGYRTVAGGVGGLSASDVCLADTVRLGRWAFAAVPVEVSRNESGVLAREDMAGVIGMELLERFVFAIDFDRDAPALWLRPANGADAPFPLVAPPFGSVDRTDIGRGWVVTGLYEGLAPEGLRPGDEIVAWDGRSTDSCDDPGAALRTPGRHRMEVRRGGELRTYETETKNLFD